MKLIIPQHDRVVLCVMNCSRAGSLWDLSLKSPRNLARMQAVYGPDINVAVIIYIFTDPLCQGLFNRILRIYWAMQN